MNQAATRYCTPIVTGNHNNRMRRIPESCHGNMNHYNDGASSEKNYRPSPITATSLEGRRDSHKSYHDSHLSYYHRPYPTIRGGQSSPSRLDIEISPRHTDPKHRNDVRKKLESGNGATTELYVTPMIHRASSSPIRKRDERVGEILPSHSSSNQHFNSMGDIENGHYSEHVQRGTYNEQAPHHNKPRNGYQQHHQNHPNFRKDPYRYGQSHPPPPQHMYLQNGSGYYSPYDPQNPMNTMNRNHNHIPNHHFHPSQYHPGNGLNHTYHPPTEGPYSQYQHQRGTDTHAHQTPIDQQPNKRRRTEEPKIGKKVSAKQPKRKKMYSDFVGVTYNKTHAKYQACITHYRKQHYLGRYKLAVDAARAYDESAKLLKGDGWKINFQTDQDYEMAKTKELEMLERRRMEADMKGGVNVRGRIAHYDPASRMVKEKLGLRMPLSHDPSIVADKMRKDRLSAVAKQAADHADQLKQNGVEMKKNRGTCTTLKNEESITESQVAKSAVTPSPHQSQSNAKPKSLSMSEPLMSPPTTFKSPTAATTALSQGSPSMTALDTKEVPNNIASSPMMLPSPSVTVASQNEKKEDLELSEEKKVDCTAQFSSTESFQINDPAGTKKPEMSETEKQEGVETTGIESNAEVAASALLMIRN